MSTLTRGDFFALWDRMLDAVLVSDAEQRIRHLNPPLEQLLRRTGAEVLGQPVDVLLPEASRARHRVVAEDFIRSGETKRRLSHPRLVKALRGDGVSLPVEVSISSAEVEGERLFVLLFRDLSEQLALQEEVAAQGRRLARMERMQSLSALSAGLSEQFTRVMAQVAGALATARAAVPGDVGAAELEGLARVVAEAQAQTRALVLFSRAAANPQSLPVDLTPALRRLEEKAVARMPPGVAVTLTLDAPLPPVRVLESEAEQVVDNLIANGLYAMRERGGHLTVLAHRLDLEVPMPCTTLTLTPGPWLAVSVEDQGEGIEAGVLPDVFDPFFTTKPRTEGTGLGLSMAYGVMRAAGGAIDVESRPGRGSRFSLFFPVEEEGEAGAGVTAPEALGTRRVLLVDGDAFSAAAVRRSLELLGHACHLCRHAADALSVVRLDPAAFDLVVCDLNLPGMRGDELADRLSIIRPGLPVCVMTSSPDRALRADGFRVLHKPVTGLDIDAVLRAVLRSTPVPGRPG